MRLKQNELKTVYVFGAGKIDDDSPNFYPGEEPDDVFLKTIRCNVQCADNKITAEVYGKKAFDMFQLLCETGVDINDSMKISLTDDTKPTHNIVSIRPYSTHTTVLIEVIP